MEQAVVPETEELDVTSRFSLIIESTSCSQESPDIIAMSSSIVADMLPHEQISFKRLKAACTYS